MAENEETKKTRISAWPLWISLLLLAFAVFLAWRLWEKGQLLAGERAENEARIAALKLERDRLKGLLLMSPCEAGDAYGQRKANKGSQGTATEPVSAAQGALNNVENACVFIVSATGPRSVATGSGFFVAPGFVATNKHVVEKSTGRILVTSEGMGQPAFGKVVAISPDLARDYAILKVDTPPGAKLSTIPFAPEAKRTQKVGAWGYPDLVGKADPKYSRLMTGEDVSAVPELSYSEGVVSAILNREPPIIVHTAPISPGNSGGPLVNEKGELVGINTMITLDEDSYRQASIALSAHDLEKFLSAHGITVKR